MTSGISNQKLDVTQGAGQDEELANQHNRGTGSVDNKKDLEAIGPGLVIITPVINDKAHLKNNVRYI